MEDGLGDSRVFVEELYALFNARDIDGCLSRMADGVEWPAASEGGRVVGKEAVRAYWTRQWAAFDPHVEPTEVLERGGGRLDVRVKQLVKDLRGAVLMDGEVWHVYALADGLVQRMDVHEQEPGVEQGDSSKAPAWRVH